MTEQLTEDQIADLEEVLRVFRQRRPLLVIGTLVAVVAIAVSSFALVLARDVDEKTSALSAEAASNQAQAKAFEGFLQRFVAEENYVCSVEAAEAQRDGLAQPPPGVCAVAPPTGRPPAAAAPQPAPTVAPVAPRPTATATMPARPMPTPVVATAPRPPDHPTPTPRRCLVQLLCLVSPGCVHSVRHPNCG